MLQLRNHGKFPPGFESDHVHEVGSCSWKNKHNTDITITNTHTHHDCYMQSNLIRSMIAKDPAERPSANEIKDGEELKKVRKSAKKQSKKLGKKYM